MPRILTGLLRPLWYPPARHLYKVITDAGYRRHLLLTARIGGKPRFEPGATKVFGWDLAFPDAASFLSAYTEIFGEQIYAFEAASPAPRILDLGANIGLSVLYFKQRYPRAEVTAYEADPRIYDYLVRNVYGNGFTDVRLVNKAVWDSAAVLGFSADGADGGRVVPRGGGDQVSVEAVDIREILASGRYDFLKMDIEGAEERVIPACRGHLEHVERVFVEYHSVAREEQSLGRIISELTGAGFRIHVHHVHAVPSPLLKVQPDAGFDLQLNIFAWKA